MHLTGEQEWKISALLYTTQHHCLPWHLWPLWVQVNIHMHPNFYCHSYRVTGNNVKWLCPKLKSWTILKRIHYHLVSDANLGPSNLAVLKKDSTLFLKKWQGIALFAFLCIILCCKGPCYISFPSPRRPTAWLVKDMENIQQVKALLDYFPAEKYMQFPCFKGMFFPQDSVIHIETSVHVP